MKKTEKSGAILLEYASGGTTVRNLGEKYGFSYGYVAKMIRNGKKKKEQSDLVESARLAKDQQALPSDVEQLQEELRKARLQISLLEAMIALSDEQHGTDIRKKAGTRRS